MEKPLVDHPQRSRSGRYGPICKHVSQEFQLDFNGILGGFRADSAGFHGIPQGFIRIPGYSNVSNARVLALSSRVEFFVI